MEMNPKLIDGVAQHALYPETFEIPSEEIRNNLKPGDFVKIGLSEKDQGGERFWTKVEKVADGFYIGSVQNDLVIYDYECGDVIVFASRHVLCEPFNRNIK